MILSGRSHHEGFCRAPGFIVHGVNLLQGIGAVTDEAFQGFFDDGDNIEEADAPVQKHPCVGPPVALVGKPV